MSSFDETLVNRAGDGTFAAKPAAAESGVSLAAPGDLPTEEEVEQLRIEAEQSGARYESALARRAEATSRPSTAELLAARVSTGVGHPARRQAGRLVRHVPEVAEIGSDGSLYDRDGWPIPAAMPTAELARDVAASVPASSPLWRQSPGGHTMRTDEMFGPDPDDELGGPNLPLLWPPPPTASYAGSDSERQSVGNPGHCEKCAQYGHLAAHPGAGCGDVGCSSAHSPSGPNAAPKPPARDLAGELRTPVEAARESRQAQSTARDAGSP